MLLRNSIFSTKKFFKKTIHTIKSLFSGDSNYRRIPKTSPYSNKIPVDMIKNQEFDNFYGEFTDRWDQIHNRKATKKIKKRITPVPSVKQGNGELDKGSVDYSGKYEKCWTEKGSNCNMDRMRRDEIEKKLKEIEKMDISNVEHVLDIEEIMHYYSRLTCPAYIDIVDKFFIDMYAEIFSQFKSN